MTRMIGIDGTRTVDEQAKERDMGGQEVTGGIAAARTRRSMFKLLAGGALGAAAGGFGAAGGGFRLAEVGQAAAAGSSRRQRGKREAQRIAASVAKAVTADADGRSGRLLLDTEKLADLSREETKFVENMVAALNDGKLGIAVPDADGGAMTVFGNELALAAAEARTDEEVQTTGGDEVNAEGYSVWRQATGVMLYVDSAWTPYVMRFATWAAGFIAGAVVAILCTATAGACLALGALTSFVYDFVVSGKLKSWAPTSFYLFFGYNRYLWYKPLKSGAWYNNQWFIIGKF